MNVRAKFEVTRKEIITKDGLANIALTPVYDGSEENEKFYSETPAGNISLSTLNKAAADQFEVGGEYYVDFTLAAE